MATFVVVRLFLKVSPGCLSDDCFSFDYQNARCLLPVTRNQFSESLQCHGLDEGECVRL